MSMLFNIFKEKYDRNKNIINITNLYQDEDLSLFYNNNTSLDDLDFYSENLNFKDKILEIGSGSGRILIPLAKQGFDIYGIEPNVNMIKHIKDTELTKKIFKTTLIEFQRKERKIYNKIIIPATSISLFSPEIIRSFMEQYLNDTELSQVTLIFDFIDPEYLEKIDKKIFKSRINNILAFSANFIHNDKFFYNVYLKNGTIEKIGASNKYIYSMDIIKNTFSGLKWSMLKQEYYNNTFRIAIKFNT